MSNEVDGASLFYTTQDNETLSILRQYVLHLLFLPPPPTTSETSIFRNPFPFTHKPNALDRDQINIPVGWDSWGKITVLREGFDCRGWGDAWDYDLDSQTSESPAGARIQYKKLVGNDERIKVRFFLKKNSYWSVSSASTRSWAYHR
jgi:dynein light intermediate chain 1, cytosolic